MEDYNLERLNQVADFSVKTLLAMNSAGFIALLSLSDKVDTLIPGILFALGLTLGIILAGLNYFIFYFSEKTNISERLQPASIVVGILSALAFLASVWTVALY